MQKQIVGTYMVLLALARKLYNHVVSLFNLGPPKLGLFKATINVYNPYNPYFLTRMDL